MKTKVIAVVGPTGTGKTELAIYLARRFGGEIISADSMQIYRELSIGTAKPTADERNEVPHHLVDFLSIGSDYSVADYVEDARKCIEEISSRGNIPIICGGTGLYVDSLLNGISFGKTDRDDCLRREFTDYAEKNGADALYQRLVDIDPEAAEKIHPNNVGRVVRALEVFSVTGKKISEMQAESVPPEKPYDVLYLGLSFLDRKALYGRCERRIDAMLKNGLIEEARYLYENCNNSTASQAIGYKEFYPYFRGEIDLEEAVSDLKKETRHYVKRQLTWFLRNSETVWLLRDADENYHGTAAMQVENFLNN